MFPWMTDAYESEFWPHEPEELFSIAEFCFYLLSPSFLKEFSEDISNVEDDIHDIAEAIHEYQRKDKEFPEWNPEPLINLLEKIPTP